MSRWSGRVYLSVPGVPELRLLYSLLNKHPEVALMYEGDLLMLKPLFWVPGMRKRWAVRWAVLE